MTTSIVDAESLLAIDVGTINTRALLFDVVEGQYRHIATGIAPTTAGVPYLDVGEGIHRAIQNLQDLTGRVIIGSSSEIILPMAANGAGIDQMAITYSAGPELRVVIAGLLPDVSISSAQRLVATVNSRVVETIGITDRRRMEVQLDAIVHAKPDLVIISGGTDHGATRSVLKIVELILLACKVIAKEQIPEVVFAGNKALADRVKEFLGRYTRVTLLSNLRPSVDVENIDLNLDAFIEVVNRIRGEHIGGLAAFSALGNTCMMPTPLAFGRMIRFISCVNEEKRVMGVDLGASAATIAIALGGKLSLNVYPLNMGAGQLSQRAIEGVMRWLSADIPEAVVRDYLWQKTLFPASLPLSHQSLLIEQAEARYVLQTVTQLAMTRGQYAGRGFEPVIASGAVLSFTPQVEQSLLMLLDGLQPSGITTLILDPNGVMSAMGAAAGLNSVLPVHILESGAFLNLGTVIAPYSRARYGSKVLQVRIAYEQGGDARYEIKQGTLASLPLENGQVARVHLSAVNGATLDAGGKVRSANFKVVGGVCGIVVDARGRPITLPSDKVRRREILCKWREALGIGNSGT